MNNANVAHAHDSGNGNEEDVRPVPPRWAQLLWAVDGAKERGFTEAQIEYLRCCLGLCWAKAYRAGQGEP